MNKKILGVFISLLAVAMLAVPMSVAYATKPETRTLTGTYYILGMGDGFEVFAGESDNVLLKLRNVPCLWTGDIAGFGIYKGEWLVKGGPIVQGGELVVAIGHYVLEDAVVDGIGVGDLSIGHNKYGLDYLIKSGSGDLRSIRGKGTITPIDFVTYDYEIVIQINP